MNNLNEVKAALNITDVITGATGFSMGKNFLEKCPFCGGHKCFSVNSNEQLFNCFQCGDNPGGDVFTFLQKYYSIDNKEAFEKGAALAGMTLKQRAKQTDKFTSNEKILIEAAKYYHSNISTNGAKKYLVSKRGHKVDTLETMQVGHSDGKLKEHLRHKQFSDKDILKSGLVRERTIDGKNVFIDFFGKNFIIYPHTASGKVLHFTMKDPKKNKEYQLPSSNRSKKWMFYNQDALVRHETVILVEGENDLQSIMDTGLSNTIACIGQISNDQIKALSSSCKKKKLILWMDNDEGGCKYIRKVCSELKKFDIKIICYPGDPEDCDPDEYLQTFKGDKRKEINRLVNESIDYFAWEIHNADKQQTLEGKLKALKQYNLFETIALMQEIKKQVYIEKLVALGFSKDAVLEQLESNLSIRKALDVYFGTLPKKADANPNVIAGILFREFSKNGRFFYDNEQRVYLLHNSNIYEISNNRPFNALIKKHTMILPTEQIGRNTWESLASEGYNSGKEINLSSWLFADRIQDAIYVNLNSPDNIILKIKATTVDEISNGLNDDDVLLRSSSTIKSFTYLPDVDVREAMFLFKSLIFDTLTCEKEQKYLIVCWLISAFLLGFVRAQALLKFSGGSNSGKSTCAGRLSLLLYGEDMVGNPSAAAAFAEASQNPMIIIDNLESQDLNSQILKFLLLAATGGQKIKRTSGTESGVTKEKPKALVLITAIEPFLKPELINRTFDIEFSQKFWNEGFVEDDVMGEILKNRDKILSAVIKLISKKILPNLKERRSYITVLQKEYPNHAKNRMNEYLALLMLILDTMLPFIPYYHKEHPAAGTDTGSQEIRLRWIEYQNAMARESEVSSNNILKMLDGIVREYVYKMKEIKLEPEETYGDPEKFFIYEHPEYGLTIIKKMPEQIIDNEEYYTKTVIEFEATSKDLVYAFDRFCKNNGLKNVYATASIFGSRLKNDVHLLQKGGWELITKPKTAPYFKTVRGQRFYKFRNTLYR